MVYAARTANLAFIVNVVLNGNHEIIGSFAGDMEAAHEKGCDFVRSLASVDKVDCDIAISTNGGYPLDQNIYQAIKGMTAAEATLPDSGIIIMIAGCRDGHGGVGFYHNIADVKIRKNLNKRLSILLVWKQFLTSGLPRYLPVSLHIIKSSWYQTSLTRNW